MAEAPTDDAMTPPLRVAVVGSGPAGFYAAGHLLNHGAEVDMFERLPTPWGLVRLGVAPDHPKIKSVSRVFEKIAGQRAASASSATSRSAATSRATTCASTTTPSSASVGAQIDRALGIPGEDLPGSLSATAFVAWYNGHPDYRDLEIDLDTERVVVVGNGNVAMDCARMLALTREELAVTDTVDHAIDVLADSPVKEIVVLGRRGPVQAAFTTPELRELGELVGADIAVDPADLELDAASEAFLAGEDAALPTATSRSCATTPPVRWRASRRSFPALPGLAGGDPRRRARRGDRDREKPARSRRDGPLRGGADGRERGARVRPGAAIGGVRGLPLEGVPFDHKRALIPNEAGRVTDEDGASCPASTAPAGSSAARAA